MRMTYGPALPNALLRLNRKGKSIPSNSEGFSSRLSFPAISPLTLPLRLPQTLFNPPFAVFDLFRLSLRRRLAGWLAVILVGLVYLTQIPARCNETSRCRQSMIFTIKHLLECFEYAEIDSAIIREKTEMLQGSTISV
jgi:hypothetical protein